jgi:hypothetical protein
MNFIKKLEEDNTGVGGVCIVTMVKEACAKLC